MTTANIVTTLTADSSTDTRCDTLRVAWLFPSLARGSYWHPLFDRFTQKFPQTVVYTGIWTGFAAGYDGKFKVEVVGETKVLSTTSANKGYSRTFIFPSLGIIPKLFSRRPEVIFASAFSLGRRSPCCSSSFWALGSLSYWMAFRQGSTL